LAGQTVGDIEFGATGFIVVAIKSPGGTLVRAPKLDTPLSVGDVVVVIGHREALPQIARKAKPKAAMTYRGASV
jgi:K+/H+ antiporter YhaU regulatory subunit KhtT